MSIKHYIGRLLPDEVFLRLQYKRLLGRSLNLENPTTYTEKLQWLKLHDRNPIYTELVDKLSVRDFVVERIGAEHLIPLIGVWDRVEEINFDELPSKFVLKCTHDSGGVVICRDKNLLNKKETERKLKKSLSTNYYYLGREWPYKHVRPRIIAETYMEDETSSYLKDYKFFCFDGKPKALFVATDRGVPGEEVKFDFFDMDWNKLNIINGHPNAVKTPSKPSNFKELFNIAAALSNGLSHVRVDLYSINGRVYFGEMTLHHFSGLVPFEPDSWDNTFGSWLRLPPKQIKRSID